MITSVCQHRHMPCSSTIQTVRGCFFVSLWGILASKLSHQGHAFFHVLEHLHASQLINTLQCTKHNLFTSQSKLQGKYVYIFLAFVELQLWIYAMNLKIMFTIFNFFYKKSLNFELTNGTCGCYKYQAFSVVTG